MAEVTTAMAVSIAAQRRYPTPLRRVGGLEAPRTLFGELRGDGRSTLYRRVRYAQ
jgi:hypothetical protein